MNFCGKPFLNRNKFQCFYTFFSTSELDREVEAMYNLTIRATDQGRPRLSETSNLVILILDVNDNPPEFASRLYFASVKEDVLEQTDVVRVLATSKDSGVNADITYAITSGNEARKFEIHPKNGMIKVNYKPKNEIMLSIFHRTNLSTGLGFFSPFFRFQRVIWTMKAAKIIF